MAPSLATLLQPNLRKEIATKVNEAILKNQGARKEARLRNLVKLRAWAEQKARDAKPNRIPERINIGLYPDDAQKSSEDSTNGNSDDAIMTNNGDIDPMIV